MIVESYQLKLHTKFAKYYDLFYGKDYAEAIGLIHWIIQNYSNRETHDLLDLMCGTGAHILGLSKRGYKKIVGIDASEEMVELAQEKLKNLPVTIIQRDARKMKFFEEFDAAYCWFNSLQYFFLDEELKKVLNAINQSLREKGLFIADLRNEAVFSSNFEEGRFPTSYNIRKDNIEIVQTAKSFSYNKNTHIATFDVEFTVNDNGRIFTEHEKHNYRLIKYDEFNGLLGEAGFVVRKVFGSSTEINVPFDINKSKKMLFVASKK